MRTRRGTRVGALSARLPVLLRIALSIPVLLLLTAGAAAGPTHPPARMPTASSHLAAVAIPFVANEGQRDERVAFEARTFGGTAFVTRDGEVVHALPAGGEDGRLVAVREVFVGARSWPVGRHPSSVCVHGFRGGASVGSRLPAYDAVDVGEIAAGVALELRAHPSNIEKLFTVAPGADPSRIRVRVDGARSLAVNGGGELEIETVSGTIALSAPIAYQANGGGREYVDAAYAVDGRAYGFTVGSYDHARPLVIDPLLASTFLGGSGEDGGYCGSAIAVSGDDVYVTGYTSSSDFPGIIGEPYHGGNSDVFVALLDKTLETLIAAAFIGGSADEEASSIALDALGNVYVVGSTVSGDFPTTVGAYDRSYGGGSPGPYSVPGDVFLCKLSGDLSTLVASTYYGGSAHDYARFVCVRGSLVYVAGATASGGMATSGAFQTSHNTGGEDGYVARFDAALTSREAASYLAGSSFDFVESMAVGGSGNVFVTGWTGSDDFPRSPAAYDTTFAGGVYDAFVTVLDPSLATLVGSTYLGGTSWDFGYGLCLDATDNVYVTGHTAENGAVATFPATPGSYDPDYNGSGGPDVGDDAFASKFDPSVMTLVASTFLGGSLWEYGTAMEWDPSGHVVITGCTTSDDYPTHAGAHQEDYAGGSGSSHMGDAFISKLTDDLAALPASTYLGGSDDDCAEMMALDLSGNVYVSGFTASDDWPATSGAAAPSHAGGPNDALVAVLSGELGALGFTGEPRTGVAPFSVEFHGQAPPGFDGYPRSWDFDADGLADATGPDADWVFGEPGLHTVRMWITHGDYEPEAVREDYVLAFDGGSALRFDGDTSAVACPAAPDLNLTSSFTLEAWINPSDWGEGVFTGAPGRGQVLDKGPITLALLESHPIWGKECLWLHIEHAGRAASESCTPDSTIVLGAWQHVAASYDALTSTATITIDGVEQGLFQPVAPSGPAADNAGDGITIGNALEGNRAFEGDIDETRVWSVVRSVSEIAANRDHPLFGDEPGLAAYWPMDDGNGDVAGDGSGGAHDAALDGPVWIQGVGLFPTGVPEAATGDRVGSPRVSGYPNPFRPSTTIAFELPQPSRARLAIYDVAGRTVRAVDLGRLAAGSHTYVWDGMSDAGTSVAAGAYFVRIVSERAADSAKVLRIK